jgi:hypothetical protein
LYCTDAPREVEALIAGRGSGEHGRFAQLNDCHDLWEKEIAS